MFELTLQFLFSALAIVLAGTFLTKSADAIAELTGMGGLFAGSIFLAGATSLPELLVDISAIRKNMPDLAVGDLLGSSLMNLLILAFADLLHKHDRKMFSKAGSEHALSAAVSINLMALTGIAIFMSPQLKGLEIGDVGLGPLAIGAAYIIGLRLIYSESREANSANTISEDSKPPQSLAKALSTYGACTLVIFVSAPFLAEAAGKIADMSGLSHSFVGTTLLGLCTSLPELVATITAVRMGAIDLAIGSIFGSNSFNMILLIPLDHIYTGNLLGIVSRSHILTALAAILATSIAVIGQLYREEKRKKFIEPDALTVIVVIVGALLLLFWHDQL